MRIIKTIVPEWHLLAPREKYIHILETLNPRDYQEIMRKDDDGKHSTIIEYSHGYVND